MKTQSRNTTIGKALLRWSGGGALAIALSGCIATTDRVVRAPITCEKEAVYSEGRSGRIYPPNCVGNEDLFEVYKIAQRIRVLDYELREIDELRRYGGRGFGHSVGFHRRGFGHRGFGHKGFGRGGFGHKGSFGFATEAYLWDRGIDIKEEIRDLKEEAGIS